MVSILGCGWLGMPLAKFFIVNGKTVKGSTTTSSKLEDMNKHGIVSYLIQLSDLTNDNEINSFLDTDILIINVPPGRKNTDADDYPAKMKKLYSFVKKNGLKKIIFISSTSVYQENNAVVNEESEINEEASAQRLFLAEEVFRKDPDLQTTVIRMSGLIGPERHPGRFFGGKDNIANGLSPVNLIHLDDCIGIISAVIEQNYWNKTIHAAAPSHPTRMEFYTAASLIYDHKKAHFIEELHNFKIISSDKLIKDLNYTFKHPDLMGWLQQSHQN